MTSVHHDGSIEGQLRHLGLGLLDQLFQPHVERRQGSDNLGGDDALPVLDRVVDDPDVRPARNPFSEQADRYALPAGRPFSREFCNGVAIMLDRVSDKSRKTISAMAEACRQRQDSAEPLWFAVMCRKLWGQNAPKELEFRTGRSDRTCRAWASGDSPPPVNILLMLLRDPECGEAILDHVMDGCEAEWWREHQRALRIAAQIDRMDLT